MKKINLFLKVKYNKYCGSNVVYNNKYNRSISRYHFRVIKGFDVRGDIRYGDILLCNNCYFCNKFIKCFKM